MNIYNKIKKRTLFYLSLSIIVINSAFAQSNNDSIAIPNNAVQFKIKSIVLKSVNKKELPKIEEYVSYLNNKDKEVAYKFNENIKESATFDNYLQQSIYYPLVDNPNIKLSVQGIALGPDNNADHTKLFEQTAIKSISDAIEVGHGGRKSLFYSLEEAYEGKCPSQSTCVSAMVIHPVEIYYNYTANLIRVGKDGREVSGSEYKVSSLMMVHEAKAGKSFQKEVIPLPNSSGDNSLVDAVTLYSESNYGGTSISLVTGEYDLTSGQYLFFNDKTSSIKVAPGYALEVFTSWKYEGHSKTVTGDIAALNGIFKSSISSIKVTKSTGKTHISYSGAQQFIEVSDTNLAQGNSARTVYAWIKTNQTSIGNIVSWGTQARTQRNGFAVRDGKAAFIGAFADYTGTVKINDGQWHHIAMIYDGNNVSIYVDGNPAGSGALYSYGKGKVQLNTQGQNLRLGNVSSPANLEFFRGEMKAVKIWNEALPASAITSTGISSSKKASFSYNASQPIPANFKLNNMSVDKNLK
jgi:hypothetical protein